MKKVLIFAVLSLSQIVMADGFVCSTNEDSLTVKVYNHTHAEDGTRTAAVMILSDELVGYSNKTIARFTDVKGTLTNEGAVITAKVDLRYSDSSRKGELIGGTKLGQLSAVQLRVAYNYNVPVSEGELLKARVVLQKRNGTQIVLPAQCSRYLKN